MDAPTRPRARTYEVRTYGCQMNVHDSERLSGLLESAGYVRAAGQSDATDSQPADVIVFNTCAVRENADNRLYGNLGHLAPVKASHPGMQIAVGGCLAQKDRGEILRRAPWVDVVFGTHNIGSLPVLLERARHNDEAQLEILESLETFPSTLPTRRDSPYSGWVSISVGCNNSCTFCIVPSLRGVEKDRRPGDVLAEIEALVSEGVLEVTLLGQNVNSYGVEFGDRGAFASLLRACGPIEGLERVRFTSPHPRDFTHDVIDAMAETPNVMPSLHMPLQSGSDSVLRAMRRSYRQERYLSIIDDVRARIPEAAITTDIIVGFPGETDDDFEATLDVVRAARFAGAFTFQYSPRPGTPAAAMDDQVPKAVVQERYERLVALQDDMAWAENKALVGRTVEVLVAQGEGRKDEATARLSGRARDNRLVHFTPGAAVPRPGDVVDVEITYAAPHHLVSDRPAEVPRRTRAGDVWEIQRDSADERPAAAAPPVLLGVPGVGAPRSSGPTRAGARTSGYRRWVPVVAAAFCPHPPVLVPGLGGGTAGPVEEPTREAADPVLERLRGACLDAVSVLVPGDRPVVVLGSGAGDQSWHGEAAGSLRPWGVDVRVGGAGAPVLPLSLTVGAWLLDQAGVARERRRYESVATGASKHGVPDEDVALLVMADGSARRTPKAPGAFHPRAEEYDAAIAEALRAGDPDALGRVAGDPLSREVMAGGAAVWVAAAAMTGDRRPLTAELLAADAPYGVGYLVARWTWAF